MKYLVTMKLVEVKLPTTPQAQVQHLEQQVIPSHETCVKLETEKKILVGGSQVGRRAEVFIVDVASNEELDQLLRSLPLWPMMEVDVTPLQSYEEVLSKERQLLERLK